MELRLTGLKPRVEIDEPVNETAGDPPLSSELLRNLEKNSGHSDDHERKRFPKRDRRASKQEGEPEAARTGEENGKTGRRDSEAGRGGRKRSKAKIDKTPGVQEDGQASEGKITGGLTVEEEADRNLMAGHKARRPSIASVLTKVAFDDVNGQHNKLHYAPHAFLLLVVAMGTIFILVSSGSSNWLEADVGGVTVTYGFFDRCYVSPDLPTAICESFDWPAWMEDFELVSAKLYAIKSLVGMSITGGCLFIVGALLMMLTRHCCVCCEGWRRRACVIGVDICFWIMVSCALVASLLFLTGYQSMQAYPVSVLRWPADLHCAGWTLALAARLLIAFFCDVHRRQDQPDNLVHPL